MFLHFLILCLQVTQSLLIATAAPLYGYNSPPYAYRTVSGKILSVFFSIQIWNKAEMTSFSANGDETINMGNGADAIGPFMVPYGTSGSYIFDKF